MINTVVQWATILSPIIAVAIAALTCWLNARDVKKQIESVKELSQQTIDNTTKEVESIKQLAKLQVEASVKQVELEIAKYRLLAEQARQEAQGINSITSSPMSHQMEFREHVMREFQAGKPQRDYKLYSVFIQDLESLLKQIKEIKI